MTKRILVSYSHDSPEHAAKILEFARALESRGFQVVIDQDQPELGPDEGWPTWMSRQIREADWVVMVFTATYRRRVEGDEQPGVGRGATYEANTLLQMFYEAGSRRGKLVPIVLGDARIDDVVATALRGLRVFRIPDDTERLANGLRGSLLPMVERIGRDPKTTRAALALLALLVAIGGFGGWRWWTSRPNLDRRVQAMEAGLTTGMLAYADFGTDAPKPALRAQCLETAVHYERLGFDRLHCERLHDTKMADLVGGLRLQIARRCNGLVARGYRAGLALGAIAAMGAVGDEKSLAALYPLSRFVIERQRLPPDVFARLPAETPSAKDAFESVIQIERALQDEWEGREGTCEEPFDEALRFAAYELGRSLAFLVTSLPFVHTTDAELASYETRLLDTCRKKNLASSEVLAAASGKRQLVDCEVLSKAIRRAARGKNGDALRVLEEAIFDLEPHYAAAIVDAFALGRWVGQSLLLAAIAKDKTDPAANASMLELYGALRPELNLRLEDTDLRTRFPEVDQLGPDASARIVRWDAINRAVDDALRARWGPARE